jgi:hypothetical protein
MVPKISENANPKEIKVGDIEVSMIFPDTIF